MSIIGSLIIFYIVYRAVMRRRSSNGEKNGAGGPPVVHMSSMRHREQRQAGPAGRQTAPLANNPVKNPPKPQAVRPAEAQEVSTMAYLEEKARQDAEEHARDKWEETRRLNRNYGGLRVAERLFEGDTVPGGKKCVTCGYCGADNLIPMLPRERYSCYFCREPLG